jgi:gluconokinase
MTELSSPVVLVIMGVSGSGKSTIAALLSERLGWTFEEGDSLHPKANVEKMAAGIPLTDEDRWPWLAKVADWIDGRLDTDENGIITCSALKRTYRNVLNRRGSGVEFVYLAVNRVELEERVEHRPGHFMPASLLDSQLDTLEPPAHSEPAIEVDASTDPQLVVDRILRQLGLKPLPFPTTMPPKKAAPPKKAEQTRKPAAKAPAAPRAPRKPRPASPRQNQSP